jgi:Ca2+-binding EF-hand superfamily protein
MDNEDAILKAFNTFDLNDTGVLNVEDLRTALTTLGDKLTDKEVQLRTVLTATLGKAIPRL